MKERQRHAYGKHTPCLISTGINCTTMSGRDMYSPPTDNHDTAPPSPEQKRGATSDGGKRSKGGNNTAEGKSPRLDLAKTLMSALNTTFPTSSLAGNNKSVSSERPSKKSNKNVTVVSPPVDSRGNIPGSASSPRRNDVGNRREGDEDFSLLTTDTDDAARANQQNKFKAGGSSVNTERLFAVSSESFELDGVARRNRMTRASMRLSDPTLAAASRVGSGNFTRASQLRDAVGPSNYAISVRGRQSDGSGSNYASENHLRSRASRAFDNEEASQLVDVRAMQRTVLAWPCDEMEGILLYCEQLREEKVKAEQQLSAIHAERALVAARGIVNVTQLVDRGPHRDFKQRHVTHHDSRALEQPPASASYRISDGTVEQENFFPSFSTRVSAEDEEFLSQNYPDL